MDQFIQGFVNSDQIAVVGVSKKKFGGTIYRDLKKRGYQVFPVHPSLESFAGDRCYPDLKSLPDGVDAAVIAVSAAHAAQVVDDARQADVAKLWFQQGPDFKEIVAHAQDLGMQVVSRKCILMYAEPVKGIHAMHRFIVRLFGKL